MLNLKKIILDLDKDAYSSVEEDLAKNKADNFLFLLQAYRNEKANDTDIINNLHISSSSFYTLKSRLYNKIEEVLAGDIYSTKEMVTTMLHQIHDICYNGSREVAVAFLQKLEKELLFFDMHNELVVVYSALKKLHLYSDKYFHYSQMYNKHIAFGLSLEKSEELLGNFCRAMGQYDFSRSAKTLETLLFLKNEINDYYKLNKSRQVEIIKNLVEIQLSVFCHIESTAVDNTEELLFQTQKAINDLPNSFFGKNWILVVDFLAFEYYRKTGQLKKASPYFEKIDSKLDTLLLYTNIALTSKFLISRIIYFQEMGEINRLIEGDPEALLYDENDMHSQVLLDMYKAMISYYKGNYKSAAVRLNDIMNSKSFKDYFHIDTDVKLTQAFIYIRMKEYAQANGILKKITRKIKSDNSIRYPHVLDIIKVFTSDIKKEGDVSGKQKDDFIMFLARNVNETAMLTHFQHEFKNSYGRSKTKN